MGIRGLTTYIDHHPELLTDHKLRDTKLIIDGNNLYHFLYYYYRVAHEYGGDYNHFSDSCTSFFTSLRSCNVEPYVVFDGAYAADGCKFQTSMGRARDRIRLSRLVATGVSAKLLPILAHDVFCSTLKRLKIPHIMCDFEADRQVAALANQWQCPVLTNDSDFFIFNVNAGVILLDYVDVLVHSERTENGSSSQYLKVQIFFCNDLMRSLKLTDHSLIVLFATLLGNDIVDSNSFDSFFARIKLPKSSNRHSTAKRQVKISSLVEWLQTMHSIVDAVSHVLANIPHDQRDKIKCLIQKSLACYTELESNLHQYFESGSIASELNLSTYDKNSLPEWFNLRIQSCDIPVALINVVASRRLLLLSQVELTKETSTYCCSRFIRQVAYGIILTLDLKDSETSLQSNIVVSEYDREQKSMQRIAVEPIWLLNDEPVPDLRRIQQLEPSRRFKFMLQVLGAKFDGTGRFPSDMQLLVALVRYWILHSHPKVTKLHVVALLMCFLKLGALDNFVVSDSGASFEDCVESLQLTNSVVSPSLDCRANVDELLEVTEGECEIVRSRTIRSEQLLKAKQSMNKFETSPRHNHAHVFDAAVVQSFCQFQTCLQAVGFIGKLLCLSPLVVEAMNALSGTVLYNIMRDLRSRRNVELYVSDLLGRSSFVWNCYSILELSICSDLPADSFKTVITIVRKKNKGKKALKVMRDVKVEESEGEQSNEESLIDAGQSINCDVQNKYTLLSLAES